MTSEVAPERFARLARDVRRQFLQIDGIVESPGTFSDEDAYWVNGKEIAHFHGHDIIELRLTRRVFSDHSQRLKTDPRVHRRRPTSDWIDIQFATRADVAFVRELAELAAAAHRPNDAQPLKPPPSGAALERRRRFH